MRTEENLLTLTLAAMLISMIISVAALADEPSCTTYHDTEGEYVASFCKNGAKHLDEDAIDDLKRDGSIEIDLELPND